MATILFYSTLIILFFIIVVRYETTVAQNSNRFIDTEERWVVTIREGLGWVDEIGEGNKEAQNLYHNIS